ncbi:hypothetical protein AX15_000909 [Amanita polypyramis BW_CC]|nr:hypothetical protein AX15_000909 [Amanita polypyramis BW_CC]
MTTIPAPTSILSREEWLDADFDLPEGVLLDAPSDKEDGDNDDNEDWDIEFSLGRTGGAKVKATATGSETPVGSSTQPFIIRRPPTQGTSNDNEDDDEGVSTIKATSTIKANAFQTHTAKPHPSTIEEDIEDAFDLPMNLTQLSLAPQPLSHRSSKNSLEWGDKDQTTSSQSSDAYSTLGLADVDPSSISTSSTSSVSFPETETEDEDGDELEGLIIPSAIFDSGHGVRKLAVILDMKKKAQYISSQVKVASPDPEEDFEAGLIFDDNADLSPSRLLSQQQSKRQFSRSDSVPLNKFTTSGPYPPSRTRPEQSKSAISFPVSSRQAQKRRQSPSPPPVPNHSQVFQTISAFPSPPMSSLPPPKHSSLRGQKSHSGLKPPSPTSTRKITRKTSLSCLVESSHNQEVAIASSSKPSSSRSARYEEPTASSRARTHKNTASRIYDMRAPPSRPSTPFSNSTALRLTMPSQSRVKSRPSLSSVFSPTSSGVCNTSPIPPRPPSSHSKHLAPKPSTPPAPKVLRRPKRLRTYGDGTELDGFADLPTDREKEIKYRVQPKGYGNRIPGATYSSVVKSSEKGPMRIKGKESAEHLSNTLRRTTAGIGIPTPPATSSEILPKKTKKSRGRRKPTLIRNLNTANAPKVIGDMKWNPQTLRWEGNDQVLRDFDVAIGTSTRPALITHLTGSSIGSPVGSFTSGARRVGNMIFDPTLMCWISTLPPEEDEPDVFANLADDEDDCDCLGHKYGTIRAATSAISIVNSSVSSSQELPSPTHSHSRTISESGSDRGSRASLVVCDVDETFIESCRAAEERHRVEMKGWRTLLSRHDAFGESDRSHLHEIRALATRKY